MAEERDRMLSAMVAQALLMDDDTLRYTVKVLLEEVIKLRRELEPHP